jgi:nucleotide-binding universal stress UspA family protein
MDRIIVGYDGSDGAERALERAAEPARWLAATLLVVSVARSTRPAVAAPVVEFVGAAGPGDPEAGGDRSAGALPAPEPPRPGPLELAQDQLERARMRLTRMRVEAEYVAEVGDAAERLLALAREREADLVVVGSREHGFRRRLLGRHVDEAVAAHAGCDVLLVR